MLDIAGVCRPLSMNQPIITGLNYGRRFARYTYSTSVKQSVEHFVVPAPLKKYVEKNLHA